MELRFAYRPKMLTKSQKIVYNRTYLIQIFWKVSIYYYIFIGTKIIFKSQKVLVSEHI